MLALEEILLYMVLKMEWDLLGKVCFCICFCCCKSGILVAVYISCTELQKAMQVVMVKGDFFHLVCSTCEISPLHPKGPAEGAQREYVVAVGMHTFGLGLGGCFALCRLVWYFALWARPLPLSFVWWLPWHPVPWFWPHIAVMMSPSPWCVVDVKHTWGDENNGYHHLVRQKHNKNLGMWQHLCRCS